MGEVGERGAGGVKVDSVQYSILPTNRAPPGQMMQMLQMNLAFFWRNLDKIFLQCQRDSCFLLIYCCTVYT